MERLIEEMHRALARKDAATWGQSTPADLAVSILTHFRTAQGAMEADMMNGDLSTEQALCEIVDIIDVVENMTVQPIVKSDDTADAIYAALEEVETLEEELAEYAQE